MEQLFVELKRLGTNLLVGLNNDSEKATTGLKTLNDFMEQKPEAVGLISRPENLKAFNDIIEVMKGKGSDMKKMAKAVGIAMKIKI